MGKANWAGRSRQILFARSFRPGRCDQAIDTLERHKMAVVFAPTDAGTVRWHQAAGNLVIPLEAVVSLDGDQIVLDVDDVEGRIVDAGMGSASPKKKSPKKRGERLADIEALRNAMIEHLRSACDYAYTAKDQHGERILRCVGGPSCIAKNRYSIAEELPLSWQAFVSALTSQSPSSGEQQDG